MNKPVIAIVGYVSSGKDDVTRILEGRGFASFSGGDVLRDIATKLGLSHDRDILINLGNVEREKFGPEILFRAGVVDVKKATPGSRFVFNSFRNPAEVALLKNEADALVVEVRAPAELRFEWMKKRKKPGDPKTREGFQRLDDIDHGIGQAETGQNIAGCVALADAVIDNDGNLEDLEGKVDELLASRGLLEGNRRVERL